MVRSNRKKGGAGLCTTEGQWVARKVQGGEDLQVATWPGWICMVENQIAERMITN